VPGRNPAEAIREYLKPLQQSLSCLSNRVLRPTGYNPGIVLQVTLPQNVAPLITRNHETLHLTFVQDFSVIEPLLLPRFKIKTHAYFYGLEDGNRTEIIAFHWHPVATPAIQFPHFHVRQGAGKLRPEIDKIHFRTDRVAFEEFCQLLIDEFDVIPERSDAKQVLENNLKLFKTHKTW